MMEETAPAPKTLEGDISTLRRALEDQKQVLVNKEAALKVIEDKLKGIQANTGPRSKEMKKEEKSVKNAISERRKTIAKVRKEIKHKKRALKGLEAELADLMEKAPTADGPITFAHKKFRHEERGWTSELESTLKAKDAYIQSLEAQLATLKAKRAPRPRIRTKKRKKEAEEESLQTTMNEKQNGKCSTSKEGQEVGDKQEGSLKEPEEEEGDRALDQLCPNLEAEHQKMLEWESTFNKAHEVYIQSLKRGTVSSVSKNAPEAQEVSSQSREVVFKEDPVKLALCTAVIFKKILEKLDPRSLAACRTVCKAWNKGVGQLFPVATQPHQYREEEMIQSPAELKEQMLYHYYQHLLMPNLQQIQPQPSSFSNTNQNGAISGNVNVVTPEGPSLSAFAHGIDNMPSSSSSSSSSSSTQEVAYKKYIRELTLAQRRQQAYLNQLQQKVLEAGAVNQALVRAAAQAAMAIHAHHVQAQRQRPGQGHGHGQGQRDEVTAGPPAPLIQQ